MFAKGTMISNHFYLLKQILPVLIGALLTVSFGTALGWSSPVFPQLVEDFDSPIPLLWEDTAFLAGCLFIGNVIGILLSIILKVYNRKVEIFLSFCLQFAGWLVMYCSNSAVLIGVSRSLVGVGHGYGTQKLKLFSQTTCTPQVSDALLKFMPLGVHFGLVLMYVVGSFVEFKTIPVVFTLLLLFAMTAFVFMPKSETINKVPVEERRLKILKEVVLEKKARSKMLWFLFLTALPFYSGSAANIVYAQLVHTTAQNPFPKFGAILYGTVYFVTGILSTRYSSCLSKKSIYLPLTFFGSLCNLLIFFNFYFQQTLLNCTSFFAWTPLILLVFYNFCHSLSVIIIPMAFMEDLPTKLKPLAARMFMVCSSTNAILSTKIFCVLFSNFDMSVSYICLAAVGFFGTFTLVFLKELKPEKANKVLGVGAFCRQISLIEDEFNNNKQTGSNSGSRGAIVGIEDQTKM